MNIKEIKRILKEKGYKVVKVKEHTVLANIKIKHNGYFVCPSKIDAYVYSFGVFGNEITLYINKGLLK